MKSKNWNKEEFIKNYQQLKSSRKMAELYNCNRNTITAFAKKIGYYSTEYQKIEDKGLFKKYEEYQMQRQDFENKKQMVIIEFFAENKDTIINFMEVSMKVLSTMLSAITWIASKLGKDKKVTEEDRASMLSDLVNSYSISNFFIIIYL